ncbi:DUF2785 domain-containing protein [Pontibacillus marinus]|uniref:DUF2785 domain-containing protein n=1 Tax=Pontibacillus marinus BH030004 = DSM 16465 TaxID=1385511 RepID=A0A0A5FZ04_9BACI|nr:DUF2785 domain-containing protein [Pontibacillus marinus]KGX86066.1 hypothetical protein N783_12900 [Pontibacillus marinus BH030004 = DSM 16465]
MTQTLQTLKQQLQSFDNFELVSQQEAQALLDDMLKHIGDPDPVIRDELIYRALAIWILNEKFNQDQLRELYDLALSDEYLFYQIGNKGDDSVFTRSFSVLLLPPILEIHKQKSFLSREALTNGLEALIHYFIKEQDVRGFVSEKGWAHSVAHAADALESFANCDEIEEQELLPVFDAIIHVVTRPSPYIHGEDERLINALETIFPKVADCFIIEWIQSFRFVLEKVEGHEDDAIQFNMKTFLRSLYFRFVWKEEKRYREAILNTLQPIEKIGAY